MPGFVGKSWLLSARSAHALAWLGALAGLVGCSGKGVAGKCADVPACGGDPSGLWEVQSECQFDVPKVPVTSGIPSAYTTPQSPDLASPPPAATTSGDWCSGLVYYAPSAANGGTIGGIQFYPAPLDFRHGTVNFTPGADASTQLYQFTIQIATVPQLTHFTPTCLQAHGANPTCDELTAGLAAQTLPNYQNVACKAASDNGCDCTYDLGDTTGDSGSWQIVGNSIYMFNSPSGNPPQVADYCVNGNTMTLSGKDGSHLIGSAGIRSMVLTKCADASCGSDAGN
jgi:hypothetical protein